VLDGIRVLLSCRLYPLILIDHLSACLISVEEPRSFSISEVYFGLIA
jgi:hypothetical protein